jgi:hypothetical protein
VIRSLIVALALSLAATVQAQPSTTEGKELPFGVTTPSTDEPGSNLTVYLLTMGPGDQVWEKFGHNAIWIHDAANRTDIAYHWGLFDFADKEFVPRFILGRMRYSMGAFDFNETVNAYRQTNRMVWAQRLNLTPAQRQKLADFVAWNILPENRFYHYDYFRDNCSTRVRDAIDNALGGVIRESTKSVRSGTTYRFHTARLTQDDFGVFTGTMYGLGEPVDRELSGYEEMFLPVRMMDRLRSVRVGNQPLVLSETVLVDASRPGEYSTVRVGWSTYLAGAMVIIALGLLLAALGKNKPSVTGVLSLAALWNLVAGIAGFVLTFLWSFTDHLYSYRNENVLQFNPMSLALFVMLIATIFRLRKNRLAAPSKTTMWLGTLIAALALVGFVIQVIPSFDQVNADAIALALPVHLAVWLMLVSIDRRARTSAAVAQ